MNEGYLKTRIRKIIEAPPSNAIVWSFAGSPFCKGGFPDTVIASHIFNGLVEYKWGANKLSATQRLAIMRFKARRFPVLYIHGAFIRSSIIELQAKDTDEHILATMMFNPQTQDGKHILTFYKETWEKWNSNDPRTSCSDTSANPG